MIMDATKDNAGHDPVYYRGMGRPGCALRFTMTRPSIAAVNADNEYLLAWNQTRTWEWHICIPGNHVRQMSITHINRS